MLLKHRAHPRACAYLTAILSNLKISKASTGRLAMARMDLGDLPHQNPCGQCGKPIAAPDWAEPGPGRMSYLWQCRACGYRFEAVAFFDDRSSDPQALAA
jgi:hypothetical protein